MLVNSRNIGYRRWITGLALFTILALASCGKKADEPTASNSHSEPTAAQSSTSAATITRSEEPSTTATATPLKEPSTKSTTKSSKESTTTKSSKKSNLPSSTLSAEAEKLGIKPTGTDCPSSVPVKGNLNKKGNKIYHEAKESGYQQVKPEICFADVATAQKAGFRAPKAAK